MRILNMNCHFLVSVISLAAACLFPVGRSALAGGGTSWDFDSTSMQAGSIDGKQGWFTYVSTPSGSLEYVPAYLRFSVAADLGPVQPFRGDGLLTLTSQSVQEGSASAFAVNFSQDGGSSTPTMVDVANRRLHGGANALQLSARFYPAQSTATALHGAGMVGKIPSDQVTQRYLAGFVVRASDRRLFVLQWLSVGQLGVTQAGNYYIQTSTTLPASTWSLVSVEWNSESGLVRYRVGDSSAWIETVQSATVGAKVDYLSVSAVPNGASQSVTAAVDELSVLAVCRAGGSSTPGVDCDQDGIGDWCEVAGALHGDDAPPIAGAVKWRRADGGNDHWYWFSPQAARWAAALDRCEAIGGTLVSVSSFEEMLFVSANDGTSNTVYWWSGARQAAGAFEPSGGWSWASRETSQVFWSGGEPNNGGSSGQVQIEGFGFFWPTCDACNAGITDAQDSSLRFICEWGLDGSLDCNRNDRPDNCDIALDPSLDCDASGRIDACEVATGSAVDCDGNGRPDACDIVGGSQDANGNGVPDGCECLADLFRDSIVNGADLGILLSQWGPVSQSGSIADLTSDGSVDGADLGVMLSLWGPCP